MSYYVDSDYVEINYIDPSIARYILSPGGHLNNNGLQEFRADITRAFNAYFDQVTNFNQTNQ